MVLQHVVAQAIERMRPALASRPQEIVTSLPEHQLAFLCDHEKLILILSHLLSNAIKFTPKGGRIEVRAALRPAGALDTGAGRLIQASRAVPSETSWVVIDVQDSGIGIPEQDRPRVFERFYRVDKARSRELGGTGLGLAIVKHIVEGHGGQVWVEANRPTGSRFVVRFPA